MRDVTVMDAVRAWKIVEELRADEGNSITFVCDNPDFNELPNSKVIVNGNFTNYECKTYAGVTVFDALNRAHVDYLAHKSSV